MSEMSKYAKYGKEVFTYAAKSMRMQLKPYFRICFCVPAHNGPAERRTAVATFPLLLATSSACCRCKVWDASAAKKLAAACFPCKKTAFSAKHSINLATRQSFTAGSTS